MSHTGYHGNHYFQLVCFCDEHAHMPLLPRQPFLEDFVCVCVCVRFMLRLKIAGNEVECSVRGRCAGQRNS